MRSPYFVSSNSTRIPAHLCPRWFGYPIGGLKWLLLSILPGAFWSPLIRAYCCGDGSTTSNSKAVAICAGLLFVAFALGPRGVRWSPEKAMPIPGMVMISRISFDFTQRKYEGGLMWKPFSDGLHFQLERSRCTTFEIFRLFWSRVPVA